MRKNGARVPIQEQPFQVLNALLQQPGEVVTRDFLREHLWHDQPFGDFDQGLNTAINKLREALGDSAANPRYVETIPRRGYRFIHSLEVEEAVPAPAPNSARPLRWMVVPLAGVVLLSGGWLILRPRPTVSEAPLRRFTFSAPYYCPATLDCPSASLSPDGKHIAFVSTHSNTRRIWVRHLDQDEPVALAGTDGAGTPFWSPDSQRIGFSRNGLQSVPVTGGIVTTICAIPGRGYGGAVWSPDGRTIVFTSGLPSTLREVPATGGEPKLLLAATTIQRLQEISGSQTFWVAQPYFLPLRGRRVLVVGAAASSVSHRIVLIDLDSGRAEVIGEGAGPFAYSPTGHLIFASTTGHDLLARPFSLDVLKPTGPPFPIAGNAAVPSVSGDGTLAYADYFRQRLAWFDRGGVKVGEVNHSPGRYLAPAISPGGDRIAEEVVDGGNLDIWVEDLSHHSRIRLTTNPSNDILPAWSPDGEQIAYGTYQSGKTAIAVRRADAAASEQVLLSTSNHERISDWSRDGNHILFSRSSEKDLLPDLWYLKRTAEDRWEPHPFLQTPFHEDVAKFSPDGRYVAYLSNESGRLELYVRPFPSGDRRWVVSRGGARQPRWGRNGKELFYEEYGKMMAVSVRTTPDFSAGAPTPLFENEGFGYWNECNYDVSADGERFLLPDPGGELGSGRRIHVVQNWFLEFQSKRQ